MNSNNSNLVRDTGKIAPFSGEVIWRTPAKDPAKPEFEVLKGRIREVFQPTWEITRRIFGNGPVLIPEKAFNRENTYLEFIRLTHRGVGKRKQQHVIGFIAIRPKTQEFGLLTVKGRPPAIKIVERNDAPWYHFGCTDDPKCKGAVYLTCEGMGMVEGIVEIASENGEWTPCKFLPLCGII